MDEQAVIELYAKYDNCRQVAEELGTYSEAVRRVLIKHGVSRTGNRPKREPKYRMPSNCNKKYCHAMIVMLCESLDVNTSDISAMTGVPIGSVREIAKRKCHESFKSQKTRVDSSTIDAADLKRLREECYSLEQIAQMLGISRHVIAKKCIEYGITYGRGRTPANKRANRCQARTDQLNKARKGNGIALEVRERNFVERLANDPRTQMYEYVGGYKSRNEKLTVRCRKCGELKETTPGNLFHWKCDHHVCFNCLRIAREKANEERRVAWEEHEADELSKDKICET